MVNILVRDVSPQVHALLQARAAGAGQSLQQYLTDLLARETQRESTRETAARWRAMAEERIARAASLKVDAVKVIRQVRDERTQHLVEVIDDPGRH